jgi:hypothetical protein
LSLWSEPDVEDRIHAVVSGLPSAWSYSWAYVISWTGADAARAGDDVQLLGVLVVLAEHLAAEQLEQHRLEVGARAAAAEVLHHPALGGEVFGRVVALELLLEERDELVLRR